MKSRKTGFTLIELMIVIGIIGVLAGIGMPYLQQARERTLCAACYECSRLLTGGCEVYKTNYAKEPSNISDIMPFLNGKSMPKCPRGGEYRFQQKTSGEDNLVVECTIHGCASSTFSVGDSGSGNTNWNLH